jgi:hypothetical protein
MGPLTRPFFGASFGAAAIARLGRVIRDASPAFAFFFASGRNFGINDPLATRV